MEGLFRIILGKYTSRNPIRNVDFDDYSPIEIEKNEDENGDKDRFQIVKHL